MNVRDEDLVRYALKIAFDAHAGQVDKAGVPYMSHVMAVTTFLLRQGAPAFVVAAGALHDVLEDTKITSDLLLRLGIPAETVDIVENLTHEPSERYAEYVARISDAGGDVALVKCGDVMDNLGRLAAITDETERARLTQKYTSALARLAPATGGSNGTS